MGTTGRLHAVIGERSDLFRDRRNSKVTHMLIQDGLEVDSTHQDVISHIVVTLHALRGSQIHGQHHVGIARHVAVKQTPSEACPRTNRKQSICVRACQSKEARSYIYPSSH